MRTGLSVRMELQADCLAGVWGFHADKFPQESWRRETLEEALRAASAIGDDRIMKQTEGTIVPDAFTTTGNRNRGALVQAGLREGD